MSLHPLKFAATITLLASSCVAVALPFSSFDPRSMAMGGAGVAVGDAALAPLFNPALLSVTRYSDNFSLVLPSAGIRVSDPDDLANSVDRFQSGKHIDNLQTAITNLQSAITAATAVQTAANFTAVGTTAASASANLSNVSTQLATLSNKPVAADGGIATVVGIPNKKFGIAFFANRSVATGGAFQYRDAAVMTGLAGQTSCISTTAAAAAVAATALDAATAALALSPSDPLLQQAALNAAAGATAAANAVTACGTPAFSSSNLQSGLNFRGVMLTEMGFAISREYRINRQLVSLGITPKIVQAQLYEVPINVNSKNQSFNTGDDYLARYSIPNFDLGVAQNLRNGWRTGLVIKNVVPYVLYFKNSPTPGTTPVATGSYMRLMPQTRAGISHTNRWSTVALDVDLYRNDPVGLENYSQYISLGGELNAWDWAQLRAGYRADLVNSARNIVSLGLGLSPFGVHADIAVAGNEKEIGASFQLGFHY